MLDETRYDEIKRYIEKLTGQRIADKKIRAIAVNPPYHGQPKRPIETGGPLVTPLVLRVGLFFRGVGNPFPTPAFARKNGQERIPDRANSGPPIQSFSPLPLGEGPG
jgi:hypothetical protein